jgi:hypothetical protein
MTILGFAAYLILRISGTNYAAEATLSSRLLVLACQPASQPAIPAARDVAVGRPRPGFTRGGGSLSLRVRGSGSYSSRQRSRQVLVTRRMSRRAGTGLESRD